MTLLNAFVGGITRDNVVKLVAQQGRQEDQAVLEWLSGSDYTAQQSSNISQRLKNTGQWLLESPKYRKWIDSKQEVLFLHGIPGAGRTILSSIVIEQLQERCHKDATIGLVYFYCEYKRQDVQQLDKIMLTWSRQLSEISTIIPPQIKALYNQHKTKQTNPSPEEIRKILYTVDKNLSKFYIVVDALDECQALHGY